MRNFVCEYCLWFKICINRFCQGLYTKGSNIDYICTFKIVTPTIKYVFLLLTVVFILVLHILRQSKQINIL